MNVDLQEFFPSINFGRVRGMFLSAPYCLPEEVATVLAQICCHAGHLPQGAPTSPIISNMICAKLDAELQRLAKRYRCTYTRYADDITFSTTLKVFPSELAKTISDITEQIEIGGELYRIILANGFEINRKKLRLQSKKARQEVTGLTVNQFVNVQRKYVRQIRAMLHAWEKHGEEAAFNEFLMVYDQKHRNQSLVSFANVVKGKIDFLGMVKGKDDSNYKRFRSQLKVLAPDLVRDDIQPPSSLRHAPKITPLIITEGKTDWKHMKAAFQSLKTSGKFSGLHLNFHEYDDEIEAGDKELLKECKMKAKRPNPIHTIYIFDRDNKEVVNEARGNDKPYKVWKNNVFSFVIPVPAHREQTPEISIEFYYRDDEIARVDKDGRRLFLSNEFNDNSGKHLTEPTINCTDKNKCRRQAMVIDNDVFDSSHKNIALPKNHFANYIFDQIEPFNDFDFSSFTLIFEIIEQIVQENYSE